MSNWKFILEPTREVFEELKSRGYEVSIPFSRDACCLLLVNRALYGHIMLDGHPSALARVMSFGDDIKYVYNTLEDFDNNNNALAYLFEPAYFQYIQINDV